MGWTRTFVEEVEKVRNEVTSFGFPSDLLDLQMKLIDKTLNVGQKKIGQNVWACRRD